MATEKQSESYIENVVKKDLTTYVSAEELYPNANLNKVLWKMDLNVLSIVSLLYLLAFLHRGNIGNAKIEGMATDLHLKGNQYNICPYIVHHLLRLFEAPSNMLLKRFSPSIWLPAIMVAWGVVMTLMGIVQSFGGLVATRLFPGVCEAGLSPGVSFYLTLFYKREEMQFRSSVFCSAASVAGAFQVCWRGPSPKWMESLVLPVGDGFLFWKALPL